MGNDRIIIESILEKRKSDSAPDMSPSNFFEYFCASEILKDKDLSNEELDTGIIGSSNDGGIDGMFIFLNDDIVQEDTNLEDLFRKRANKVDIYIIQTKKTDGFSEETVNKFASSFHDIFDLSKIPNSLLKVYNTDLIRLMSLFQSVYKGVIQTLPEISFSFYYATLGNEVHPNVERKVDQLKKAVYSHFDNARFSFDFIGARDLLQLVRRKPASTFELEFTENPISIASGSYVCLVPIKNYYHFFIDENGSIIKRIFDANVRDYQGNTKVNRAIQETLQRPSKEDFWFLNNGVTIVCKKALTGGKKLIIDDPQIVNGLQTSHEIFSHFRNRKVDEEDNRRILVRVIVEQDQYSRDNIVRATNSQTSIPETSLRAADKIQRDIEDYFVDNDYYYERRKNYYKNLHKPLSRIISISYLSQVVISVLLQKPDYARARPSTLINSDEEYIKIFNHNHSVSFYLNCVKIMKCVEQFIKSVAEEYKLSRKEVNNIQYHVAMLVVMKLTDKQKYIRSQDVDKIRLSDVEEGLLRDLTRLVYTAYQELGATDQVSKGSKMVERVIEALKSTQELNTPHD